MQQILGQHAQKIAKTYDAPIYKTAADNLRVPFWDWAAEPQRFPDVLLQPKVRIYTPCGIDYVKNPLYQYNFQGRPEPDAWFPKSGPDAFFGTQNNTIRQPDQYNQSQEAVINAAWFNPYGWQLSSMVFSTFSQSKSFNAMSTFGVPGNSFETPHGNVHYFVGGDKGHMLPVPFSAFDPAL